MLLQLRAGHLQSRDHQRGVQVHQHGALEKQRVSIIEPAGPSQLAPVDLDIVTRPETCWYTQLLQAISRSLFAQMIPDGKEAEFYSFYEVSERGTSWIGPLIFGLANQLFGSLRYGILSLIFFFILGLILLPRVNVDKAIADVKAYDAAQKNNNG